MRNRRARTAARAGVCGAIVLTLCALPLGCTDQRGTGKGETSHLKPLAVYYLQYSSQRGGPPASEDELKQFVRQQAGDADPESLFVSPRDEKPYVIVYGREAGKSRIVAYEQVGVKGKRYVADNLGIVEEVDEARFRELVPNTQP